jgi:hypothetical protein
LSFGDRCLLEFGASISAIQSSRHCSCASRAQGHGLRHSEDVGVSSVSSVKHIQHRLGSCASCGVDCAGICLSSLSSASLPLLECDDGFSRIVCESSDMVECASLSDRLMACDGDGSGLPDRCVCDGRRWEGGSEAMFERIQIACEAVTVVLLVWRREY